MKQINRLNVMYGFLFFSLTFSILVSCGGYEGSSSIVQKKNIEEINVAKVWSGHPSDFDIWTTDKYQYVAYYDTSRNMCIAQHQLDSKDWKITRLSSVTGWDSHNYIDIALDKEGYIHISGNMHAAPLVYFRSMKPYEVNEFVQLPMTGQNETSVTYPVFFNDSEGNLSFQYRDGVCGRGVTRWNIYDQKNKKWIRIFENGIFDGEGEVAAYPTNPTKGPDGYFYIVWMWRITPTANTNHNLSCIRSLDLIHWETIKGKPLTLPVKWQNSEVCADHVGPWNGLINMNFFLSWDNQNRLCITYHKYGMKEISQVFVARWETDLWKIYQISRWQDYKWDLDKRGALGSDIIAPVLKPIGNNRLMGEYYHIKYGKGLWIIDEKDFRIIKDLPNKTSSDLPTSLLDKKPENEGMIINRIRDNTGNYLLQWETLPVNQDRPRDPPYPAPTMLKVIKLSEN